MIELKIIRFFINNYRLDLLIAYWLNKSDFYIV